LESFHYGGFDLELNHFDLDGSKVKFVTDIERLWQKSWQFDFWFSRNHNKLEQPMNERTNKPTNQQTNSHDYNTSWRWGNNVNNP